MVYEWRLIPKALSSMLWNICELSWRSLINSERRCGGGVTAVYFSAFSTLSCGRSLPMVAGMDAAESFIDTVQYSGAHLASPRIAPDCCLAST